MASGDLQHIFGFMPQIESLDSDNNLSIALFVHDSLRFRSILVFTDFIDDTHLGDVKAPVLKSFLIDKLHFETTQGLISKSFHNLEL